MQNGPGAQYTLLFCSRIRRNRKRLKNTFFLARSLKDHGKPFYVEIPKLGASRGHYAGLASATLCRDSQVGSLWKPLGASGNLWEPLGASRSLWEPLEISGRLCEPLYVEILKLGANWKALGTSGILW